MKCDGPFCRVAVASYSLNADYAAIAEAADAHVQRASTPELADL
jgi:hypothetical protein